LDKDKPAGHFTQDFKNISEALNIKMENKNMHNISQTTGTQLHPWKTSWKFYIQLKKVIR